MPSRARSSSRVILRPFLRPAKAGTRAPHRGHWSLPAGCHTLTPARLSPPRRLAHEASSLHAIAQYPNRRDFTPFAALLSYAPRSPTGKAALAVEAARAADY